jgi:4-hydroxybenzoate polyprenyltransferase
MKRRIADAVRLDPAALPYRTEVIELIERERRAGRRIVLLTGADQSIARSVADHLKLFDEVLASDGQRNLKGAAKVEALRQRFGQGHFDYVGDCGADLAVWKSARRAYVVNPTGRLLSRFRALCPGEPQVIQSAADSDRRVPPMLRVLRPHQWLKNLLIFVPLLLAHRYRDWRALADAGVAFVGFCVCASAIYVINDMLDVQSDRRHPTKRRRPLASGELSLSRGLVLAAGLLAFGFLVSALLLRWKFSGILLLYCAIALLYSTYLKQRLFIDVLTLAGLYTLRLMGGGAATDVVLSKWLLAFSMFWFTSLAFVKRYSELRGAALADSKALAGRSYITEDLAIILNLGSTSGYMSIVVFCLYINSAEVAAHYRHPDFLWLVCPLLLYWISRVWFLTSRHLMEEDPVVFAVTDRRSWVIGALAAGIVLAAI